MNRKISIPSRRLALVQTLVDLCDEDFQKECWINRKCPQGRNSDNLLTAMSYMLDDLLFIDQPEDEVGLSVYSTEEATCVQKVCRLLYSLLDKYGDNESDETYISTPEWQEIMSTARQAKGLLALYDKET